MSLKKKIVFSLIPLFVLIAIIEIGLHIFKPNFIKSDKLLGWKLKDNFNFTYKRQNSIGEEYSVNFSTDEIGMRRFYTGNVNEKKLNILVIGDSFTSDPNASNDQMWYSHIAKSIKKNYKIDVNVFAIGAGGYGSLQQLLLLREIKKRFEFEKIDLVIFQFCNNDIHNNYLSIEKKEYNVNQYARRPFYDIENYKIYYDNSFSSIILRTPFIGESRILNKIFFILNKIRTKDINLSDQIFSDSIKITKKIISEISKEFNSKKVLMVNFSVEDYWPYNQIPIIAKKNNFSYIKYPADILKNKEYFLDDGSHLSDVGNKIYGEFIFEKMISEIKMQF